MNKQSKKVELCVIQHAALKNNRAYLLRTEITKSRKSMPDSFTREITLKEQCQLKSAL